MSSASTQPGSLTTMEVLADLEVGRSRPPRPVDRLTTLRALPRPTLGGRRFVATYLTAGVLGRIHPRLARRLLLHLWFTPWPPPSALRPVNDLPDDLVAWSLPVGGRTLASYAGGTGPTVVLAHGWAGRAADWCHLAHDLIAAGWRIVAPDLPGHGMTPGDRPRSRAQDAPRGHRLRPSGAAAFRAGRGARPRSSTRWGDRPRRAGARRQPR